jgi:hypothetical protein
MWGNSMTIGTVARRMIRTRCILAGLLILTQASAHAATQIGSVTVTGASIYMGNVGGGATGAYIDITPAQPVGLEGCSGYGGGTTLWIDFSAQTAPDGKALYATVMAAFLAGRTLTFGVSGCGYSGQMPQIYRVDIS